MIELVVFDMAGTTVYDGAAVKNAFTATLLGAGVRVEPMMLQTVMGMPKPVAIRQLLAAANRLVTDDEVTLLHADFVRRMESHYQSDPGVRAIPGAAEAFAAFRKAGIKVALNTGFSRSIVKILMARLGWQVPATVDAVVASDELPRGRPHPDMILHLMERLGIRDARQVAKVGDTAADLEEGTRAGCGWVIGVTTGSYTREQLAAFPHSHIVTSVADVPDLLLRL